MKVKRLRHTFKCLTGTSSEYAIYLAGNSRRSWPRLVSGLALGFPGPAPSCGISVYYLAAVQRENGNMKSQNCFENIDARRSLLTDSKYTSTRSSFCSTRSTSRAPLSCEVVRWPCHWHVRQLHCYTLLCYSLITYSLERHWVYLKPRQQIDFQDHHVCTVLLPTESVVKKKVIVSKWQHYPGWVGVESSLFSEPLNTNVLSPISTVQIDDIHWYSSPSGQGRGTNT